MRQIHHQLEDRLKARIFAAEFALLLHRLLHRRLEEAGIDFSPEPAVVLSTIHLLGLRLEEGNLRARRGASDGCPDWLRVLKASKLNSLKPSNPTEGEQTVM